MKQIKLKLSEYEVMKALVKNFDATDSEIPITINGNIKPYFSLLIEVGKTTMYNSIKRLKELKIIKYRVVNGYGYLIKKGKNYNNVTQQIVYE